MEAVDLENIDRDNVVKKGENKVLRAAAIYGANSSGKSNVLRAMSFMRNFVLDSIRINKGSALAYYPFVLTTEPKSPSFFEVVYIHSDCKYRYGFEATEERIISEWYAKTELDSEQEVPLFYRTLEDGIMYDEEAFPEGVGKVEHTPDERLFISLCSQLNGKESSRLVEWINKYLNLISGSKDEHYIAFTSNLLADDAENRGKMIQNLCANLQLGFQRLDVIADEESGTKRLESVHHVYDESGEIAGTKSCRFYDMESEGTIKLVHILGPIVHTLQNGGTLLIDELDAKLHPLISQSLIRLFADKESNPQAAQLVFATHDTNLLSSQLLYPDQIWFTEKNPKEETDLYCLTQINTPRGDLRHNIQKIKDNYIFGRYGAIPYIVNM